MAYHTLVYLLLFLPLVLLAYQIVPKKIRRWVLLLAGYAFFWSFSGRLVFWLIGTTLWSHYIGIWQAWLKMRCREEMTGAQKRQTKNRVEPARAEAGQTEPGSRAARAEAGQTEPGSRAARAETGQTEPGSRIAREKVTPTEIRTRYKRQEKWLLILGVTVLLVVLAHLKYYNFFAENANRLSIMMGGTAYLTAKSLLLPIGISFYTLQAIGYMADVYWEKIQAERNLGKLALFLSFFPQIMEGPISMYSQTADALWQCKALRGENLTRGSVRILWGLFKKMLIADRLYLLVQAVFEHYEKYSGIVVVVAAIAYTVQLYMEFSGCMDIVIGSGQLLGVTLPENFRQPFAARNAADFWRRWHITLGVWFKTYIFFPVSASGLVKRWSRFARKHMGKHIMKVGISAIALFPVWLCNGLWHGPRWSYIFYGMYYYGILMCGIMLEPVRSRILKSCHINANALYYRMLQIGKTWIIIFTGELFFRADSLRQGMYMFQSIFHNFQWEKLWDGTFLGFGLDQGDYLVISVGCIIVAIVGMIRERKLLGDAGLWKMKTPVRWAVYYSLILAVIVFGAYGIGYQQVDLIYAGF